MIEPPQPTVAQDAPLGRRVPQVNVDLEAGVMHLEASHPFATLVQRDLPGFGVAYRHGLFVIILSGAGLRLVQALLIREKA